jgi:hypothetical protein
MGRPQKFTTSGGYAKLTIGCSHDTKARLERAAALLSVKMGKRLSLGETLDLLLDESESVKQMEKAAAKAAKA